MRARLTAAAIAVGIAVAGCGSSGDTSARSAADKTQQARLDFAHCMRQQGIALPDPKPAGNGDFSIEVPKGSKGNHTFERASAKCDRFLKAAVGSNGPNGDPRTIQKAALAYARCMRQQGVEFPDPQFTGGMVKIGGGANTNPDDPAFRRANASCQRLLPGGGRGPTPAPAAGGGPGSDAPAGAGGP
jgi:hypothetical protein